MVGSKHGTCGAGGQIDRAERITGQQGIVGRLHSSPMPWPVNLAMRTAREAYVDAGRRDKIQPSRTPQGSLASNLYECAARFSGSSGRSSEPYDLASKE